MFLSHYFIQLEFLEFESLTGDTSKLTMQIVYRSVEDRDNMMKLPFAQGVNGVHLGTALGRKPLFLLTLRHGRAAFAFEQQDLERIYLNGVHLTASR